MPCHLIFHKLQQHLHVVPPERPRHWLQSANNFTASSLTSRGHLTFGMSILQKTTVNLNLIELAHGSGLVYLSSKLNWTNHHIASLRYVSNAIQVTYSRPKSKEIQAAVRCHAAVQFILNQGEKFFHILPKITNKNSWRLAKLTLWMTMWKKQIWQALNTFSLNSDQETRLHQTVGWRSPWSSQWSSDAASPGPDDQSATSNKRIQQPCDVSLNSVSVMMCMWK